MENQYKLTHCKSQSNPVSGNDELTEINKFSNAKAVVWYYDEIVFYNIENGKWSTAMKKLDEVVQLRLFDKDKELHLWRSNGVLKGRLRTDIEGVETEYLEARQILNGTSFMESKTGIKATEEKGICYELPFSDLKELIGTKKRIVLVTRNFIGYTDIGQAGYIDSRFVDFEIFKSKN